ncbi:uncharacterized protein [Dermacentor albipictus]|uniref:uncharacterized protein n=1 Tax=Dermacentor albipictus TaxID=60249 RepID=UPI0031FCAE9B
MNRSRLLSMAFLTGFAVQVAMSDGAPQSDISGVPPGCGDPRTATASTTSPTTTTTETTPRTSTQKRRLHPRDFGLYFDSKGCKHKVLWKGNQPLTVSCLAECRKSNVTASRGEPCAVVTNPGEGAPRFGTRLCHVGRCLRGSCSPRGRRTICQVRQAMFHRNYRRY